MCEVIPQFRQPAFNAPVPVLNQYLRVVLDPFLMFFVGSTGVLVIPR